MYPNHSTEDRRCPDCGTQLDTTGNDMYVCPHEGSTWVLYGPRILLRPPVVTRSVLELPWETQPSAAAA